MFSKESKASLELRRITKILICATKHPYKRSSKNIQIANGQYYSTAAENSSKINLNEEAISEKFEGYIQDMAMISLQPDSSQRELEEKIIQYLLH